MKYLYSCFCFGVFFASCLSFQGALLNPSDHVSLNGFFYILGIGTFFLFISECIYKLCSNLKSYFWRVRILAKTMILSLCHLAPVYIIITALIADLALMGCQYYLS